MISAPSAFIDGYGVDILQDIQEHVNGTAIIGKRCDISTSSKARAGRLSAYCGGPVARAGRRGGINEMCGTSTDRSARPCRKSMSRRCARSMLRTFTSATTGVLIAVFVIAMGLPGVPTVYGATGLAWASQRMSAPRPYDCDADLGLDPSQFMNFDTIDELPGIAENSIKGTDPATGLPPEYTYVNEFDNDTYKSLSDPEVAGKLDSVSANPDDYPITSETTNPIQQRINRIWAARNRYLQAYSAKVAQGQTATKKEWSKWLKKYIKNQGNYAKGKAYESEFLKQHGMGPGWRCDELVGKRYYDAVKINDKLKVAYEFKAGNQLSQKQVGDDCDNIINSDIVVIYVVGKGLPPRFQALIDQCKEKIKNAKGPDTDTSKWIRVITWQAKPKVINAPLTIDGVTPEGSGTAAEIASDEEDSMVYEDESLAETLDLPDEDAQGGASDAGASGGANAPAPADANAPGGIDLSSVELRYLHDDSQGFRYAFQLPGGTIPEGGIDATSASTATASMHQASDAFFVWLKLDPSKFWVNLNPNQPDTIIDPELAKTDVGRVLLEADFKLKQLNARMFNPDTPSGANFWRDLNASRFCMTTRAWIVPLPATVYQTSNELYIVDAPLDVKDESNGAGTTLPSQCAGMGPADATRASQVFDADILPAVRDAVNTSPDFAELRRAYRSRVAAEWYKNLAGYHALPNTIDQPGTNITLPQYKLTGVDVSRFASQQPWSPQDIFNQYVAAYQNPTLTEVTHPVNGIDETVTFGIGGVDFGEMPTPTKLTQTDLAARWPGAYDAAKTSLLDVAQDGNGATWLGGRTGPLRAVLPPKPPPAPSTSTSVKPTQTTSNAAESASPPGWFVVIAVVLAAGLVAVGVLWVRANRRGPSRGDKSPKTSDMK